MAGNKKKRSGLSQLFLAARAGRTALSAKLAVRELYPGQDAVLLALGEEAGLSLRDLATRLAVRPPTITKTMARLSAQGFIEKRASPRDARQSHAFLTEKGEALLEEIKTAQRSVERAALAGFTDRDRRRLKKLLRRVEKNLGHVDDEADEEKDGDD
ncbi:MarR family transcriptional regulator [Aureimonas endophytica]|uniref:MarR family transcriptional regulator n=1 Tax=Aureimonas endophytica TaxID=2027858 RepID=A0A917A3M1_9HYPH|nr:MarR family transcriptional regulator [Aureimonas endophytica]GGE25174.1 MarR family transcriptional regulator [Aureimonas endophytica]